jgi:hypothetical protein
VRLDFWNNPLVVTAMRLKYRRGTPGLLAALWVVLLSGVGVLLFYLATNNGFRFPTAYLVAILSIQGLVSAILSLASTSSSMNAEVVNRTLDFQRIVSLSPQQILVGKMLGEPTISYFLALASMPLAALCWGIGAASGAVIVLLYVNVATFALMWAAVGLIHSLAPPQQTAGARQRSGIGGLAFVFIFILPQLLIRGANLLDTPGIGDLIKLLTPIGSLIHLWQDSAWNARIGMWGVDLPSLVVAPVAQLAIAAWIVAAMARRLKNPVDPAISKPRAYATLAVLDLVFAGICYAKWREGYDATHLVYGYALAHIVACLLILFAAVPRRQALVSWLWRRRAVHPGWRDRLIADRADVGAAVIAFGLIGVAVLAAALVAPMAIAAGPAQVGIEPAQLAEVCLAAIVIVVAAGLIHQLCVATAPRGGTLLYVLFMVMANLLPPVTVAMLSASGAAPGEPTAEAVGFLSPVVLFSVNMNQFAGPYVGAGWLIAVYGIFAAASYLRLWRWMRREAAVVTHKLASMALA